MLSISNPIKGAAGANYYLKLAQEDYYAKSIEQPGQWFGRGAQGLGLKGQVEREPFHHLFQGLAPDGQHPLVQNARQPERVSGWDLTFNAPKSVSVLWAFAPQDIRQQIEQIHQHAVEVALAYLERTAGVTRRGHGGIGQEPAALVFAVFEHGSSRDHDPHLHSHAVLLNVGLRQDGTAGTLHSRPLFCQKMTGGAVYQTELAAGLHQHLGLTIEVEKVGFHLRGMPRDLCQEFSQRRQTIERVMQERGLQGAIAAKLVARDTRPRKQDIPREQLRAQWQTAGDEFGWSRNQAVKLIRPGGHQNSTQKEFQARLCQAAAAIPEQARTAARLLRLGTKLATEHGVDVPNLFQSLRALPPPKAHRRLPTEWRRLFDKTPWIPARRQFLHVEWQPLFPLAPWGPAKNLRLPRLVAELPRIALWPHEFKPRWWRIRYKRDLIIGELRVQERILFPNAPRWSPLHGLSLPALHFTFRKSQWQPTQQHEQVISHWH